MNNVYMFFLRVCILVNSSWHLGDHLEEMKRDECYLPWWAKAQQSWLLSVWNLGTCIVYGILDPFINSCWGFYLDMSVLCDCWHPLWRCLNMQHDKRYNSQAFLTFIRMYKGLFRVVVNTVFTKGELQMPKALLLCVDWTHLCEEIHLPQQVTKHSVYVVHLLKTSQGMSEEGPRTYHIGNR